MRLAVGKRIKTLVMGSIESIATGVAQDKVCDSHTWDEDVTVIGFDLAAIAEPLDADANADGLLHVYMELSRSGTRAQPGILGRVSIGTLWTAAITIGAEIERRNTVMFPVGYGMDFNESSVINVNALFSYIGGAGPIPMYAECIVYYVER